MAWDDKPTPRQIGAFLNLVQWQVTNEQEKEIRKYLEANCTRRELSAELGRVRDLYIDRRLNRENVFASKVWDDFRFKEAGC